MHMSSRYGREAVLRLARLTVALATAAVAANAQVPADSVELAFASASVKPAASSARAGQGGIRLQRGGVLSATAVTLRELLDYAYQRHPFDDRQVIGGPVWLDTARFDVVARAPQDHWIDADGAPRRTWAMLRKLLTERFKLRVEEEKRNRSMYVLTQVTKDGPFGPGIRRTKVDCGAVMRGQARPPAGGWGPPCSMKRPPRRLVANTVTMPTLASLLSWHVDREVVDGTGLAGRFDVQLEATEIKAAPDYRPGPSDLALPRPAAHTIYVAVREHLGLKLEPRFAALAVPVVRHAEYPVPD
jgi:uncharacterized protein (TIGR03435 family)